MNKKTAVLGGNLDYEDMLSHIDDSQISKFVNILHLNNMRGLEFSDYILLDGWASCYRNPGEILSAVKLRIR